jgi:hypothetical protein
MDTNNFAGEMLLEWFTQNREKLASRGLKLDRMLSDPTAFWIDPSAFIEFETDLCMGLFEITRFGVLTLIELQKVGDSEGKVQNWLCLEPAAIAYRKENNIADDLKEEAQLSKFIINQPTDYSEILEPVIGQILQPQR